MLRATYDVLVTTSYEGSNGEEQFEMVLVINNNNYYVNIVSDFNSDDGDDDIQNNKDNSFDQDIDDPVKETPQNHYECKSDKSCWKC